jgi:serine/threonine protein kinase
MSPEQLQGKPFELSSDLWALAVVAYEILTGDHPFARPTTAEWQRATFTASFIPISTHFPDTPSPWQQFFARAFALNPLERPGSARMFFTELEQALSDPIIAKQLAT